ncbi:MAG: DUF2071 domain-containing protein [Pirellulales bacterium]
MHHALAQLDHRPYPLPAARWTWRQNWHDLLFAHYPIPAPALRPLVHAGLTVQEFGGTSWIGVVPFRMTGVMRRSLPDVPWLSAFPELNLRIYVERDGIPGVWFLSLDATNALAVWAARRWFHLPYHRATIDFTRADEAFRFRLKRCWSAAPLTFAADYRPHGEPFTAQPGTLERFLVERYCLYAASPRGDLFRCDVHHHPWPLRRAEGNVHPDALLRPHGILIDTTAPHLLFSSGVDVVVWSPVRVG